MTELLNASYILDGVPMPLSPAKMLRECTVEPPLEPDGDPADESVLFSPADPGDDAALRKESEK